MPIFDIQGGEPIITPEALTIPGIRDIWDEKEPLKSQQKVCYIYHTCHPKSGYAMMRPDERLKEVEKDQLTPFGIKIDKQLTDACTKYSALLRDAGVRLLEGMEVAVDEITKILKDKKTYAASSKIKFSEITGVIQKGNEILTSYYKLRKQVEEGFQDDVNYRGGGEKSMVEEFAN